MSIWQHRWHKNEFLIPQFTKFQFNRPIGFGDNDFVPYFLATLFIYNNICTSSPCNIRVFYYNELCYKKLLRNQSTKLIKCIFSVFDLKRISDCSMLQRLQWVVVLQPAFCVTPNIRWVLLPLQRRIKTPV